MGEVAAENLAGNPSAVEAVAGFVTAAVKDEQRSDLSAMGAVEAGCAIPVKCIRMGRKHC